VSFRLLTPLRLLADGHVTIMGRLLALSPPHDLKSGARPREGRRWRSSWRRTTGQQPDYRTPGGREAPDSGTWAARTGHRAPDGRSAADYGSGGWGFESLAIRDPPLDGLDLRNTLPSADRPPTGPTCWRRWRWPERASPATSPTAAWS